MPPSNESFGEHTEPNRAATHLRGSPFSIGHSAPADPSEGLAEGLL